MSRARWGIALRDDRKGKRSAARSLRFRTGLSAIALVSSAAIAGGPVTPELSSFSPPGREELVEKFTGDFRYAVPLMEIPGPNGGYPITMTYASGVTPAQDASWVGLGWTLNPGGIVRQMRGIPDDFDGGSPTTGGSPANCSSPGGSGSTTAAFGDAITTTQDIEPNLTFGLGTGADFEFFGADLSVGTGVSAAIKAYFDNVRGYGISHTVGLSGQLKSSSIGGGIGVNFSEDSIEGGHVGAQASLSLADGARFSGDLSFDPYRGLTGLSVGTQYSYQGTNFLNLRADLTSYLGYAKPASLPATGRPMAGSNLEISFKAGGEVYGGYINASMMGFYNQEQLACQARRTAAFGFLHLHEATDDDAVDFNRERDGPIYDNSPNLTMPVLTNDLFVATGRDVSGAFRAYRNDAPVVHDPREESSRTGGALGFDTGYGNLVKVGINGVVNHSDSVVKRWDGGNGDALMNLPANSYRDPSNNRERTYFKFIGELTASANPAPVDPIAVPLSPMAWNVSQLPPTYFQADAIDLKPPPNDKRVLRATPIEAFTYKDLREQITALPEFKREYDAVKSDTYRRDNHLAGFRITTTGGLRYVYGLAAYNTDYQEHKFSVDRAHCQGPWCATLTNLPPRPATSDEPPNAVYDYRDEMPAATANIPTHASEKFLEIKQVSPYAAAYQLTAIVGADYVDADAIAGPSDGDYGYWVKFNYEKDLTPFKWRTPYTGASFIRGTENGAYAFGKERMHDKGYFVYGERENWYLSTIETATHKAYFCVDRTRPDARGVDGIGQSAGPTASSVRPARLTSLKLFTKTQLGPNPPARCDDLGSNSVPLVEAHLEYDYSLAEKAPNQEPGQGKLTLKKIHFSHLGNTRGRLNPYTFEYGFNPAYQDGDHDRWNTYQARPTTSVSNPGPNTDDTPRLDDYLAATTQDSSTGDQWAGAWALHCVVEPSSRKVCVDYEADDYAYVQDKPAMRMFPITSVDISHQNVERICPADLAAPSQCSRDRIYFKLDHRVGCSSPSECDASSKAVQRDYLGDNAQLFFKIRVALKANPAPEKWQTVSGYAGVIGAGVEPDGSKPDSDLGYIDLAPVHQDSPNHDYHPLSHAAWQYLRLEQPEIIRDGGINGDPGGNAFSNALGVLTFADAIPDIIKLVTGLYPVWMVDGYGQTVDLTHSYIRLQVSNGIKKGGGARVKRIAISDDWRASTGQKSHDLVTGYEYSYRLADGRSSGVASYEPMTAGEENPLRSAKPFTSEVLLSSSYNLFAELPIGEAYYPSPGVGYSRVVRRSLAAVQDAKNQPEHPTSMGPTVYEYYTARDFPVRQKETPVTKMRNPFPHQILIPFLGEITLNSLTASQGYTTISNDMHGKLKRVTSYEYIGDAVDPTTHDYQLRLQPVQETTYNYRKTGGYSMLSGDTPNANSESEFC